ncbi:hypothetical protein TSTA_062270 [Talaromyces stipitatus ATCC 10500]|uniref:Uncharacterized protein n=1 Tax=Talaromyces stipitatus (strain ATCC 10500 / CBS 375.48 / QM 6759 / NRRL 1006) TaxID=441959 RepID=B8LX90_TALSN|nr:uncharacterized protein TSTA_062270 [Talaromyces stipitatus ATCC 10500]EED22740.1 hypothetical protein TSTA_062270 [Talaromyces stipitatus ATCC 10500]
MSGIEFPSMSPRRSMRNVNHLNVQNEIQMDPQMDPQNGAQGLRNAARLNRTKRDMAKELFSDKIREKVRQERQAFQRLIAVRDAEIAQLKADLQGCHTHNRSLMQAMNMISRQLHEVMQGIQQHENSQLRADTAGDNNPRLLATDPDPQNMSFPNDHIYVQLEGAAPPFSGTVPSNNAYSLEVQPLPQVAENIRAGEEDDERYLDHIFSAV